MKNILLLSLSMISATLFGQEDYYWNAVPIGGGGYIIGMKIHPTNSNLIYYRTDIGGAYRWDEEDQKLIQLIHFSEDLGDYYGVAGIALDPSDEDKVILAVGRRCNLAQSAILVSNDKGNTWTVHPSPIYFATNGGRECSGGTDKDRQGSPIALNPNNTDEVYIGSRGDGLWRLDITTGTFTHLASTIIPSNIIRMSIRSVVFHPTNSNIVFVGYADYGIYRGDVNMQTYVHIDAGNTNLEKVSDLSISKDGDMLFAACKDAGIYRSTNLLDMTPTFNKVLDYNGTDPGGEAFLTVTCSPHVNNMIVTVYSDWNSLDNFFTSTSDGDINSWTQKAGNMETNIFTHRTIGYGSHISQIAFDPLMPNKLYYTSWFSTAYTEDWTASPIQWSNENALGHEEVVITDICTFNANVAGNFLGHTGGDQTGFLDNEIIQGQFPMESIRSKINDDTDLVKGASMDVCFNNSDNLVACFTKLWDNSTGDLVISNDGGQTFTRSTGYDDNLGKSVVAISSINPDRIVIATNQGIKWSDDGGNSFSDAVSKNVNTPACTFRPAILPMGWGHPGIDAINTSVFSTVRPITADKELSCVFYFYDWLDGSFHVSTNNGEEFFKVYDGLPKFMNNGTLNEWRYKTRLHSIPGHAQHLWINFDTGLYSSSDGGQNWTLQSNVQVAKLLGVGMQMAEGTYPTLFLYGKANGDSDQAYYRSIDQGQTWIMINDLSQNEEWGSPKILQGDYMVEGRVYVGPSGLGLLYGDIASPPAGCQQRLTLYDLPLFSGTYQAMEFIKTDGQIVTSQNTVFQTGGFVELKNGFSAELGGIFEIKINGCN